jgi:hypothetical protein
MGIVLESFSIWLESQRVDENISAAKLFMQSRYAAQSNKSVNELTPEERDQALKDPEYLKIVDLTKGYPGYAMPFIKFYFDHGATVDQLKGILDIAKNKKHILQQLSKPIEQWANTEEVDGISGFTQLTDEISAIERAKEAKWFVDAMPRELRDRYRSASKGKQKELDSLAIELKKLGDRIIRRLIAKIKSLSTWPIEDVISYVASYVKGYQNLGLQKKMEELENIAPQAGILYSDNGYLVMSMRTEKAQKELCSVGVWCINKGSFHNYADRGLQINIFNFSLEATDPMYLVGTTITFDGKVSNCHDINNTSIIRSTDPRKNYEMLGYPEDLIEEVMNKFDRECSIKKAVDMFYQKSKGLKVSQIIESLIASSKALIEGTITEKEWENISGIVAEIIAEQKKISKKDFMDEFRELGIYNQAALNVFDALIGNDYTKSDIEDILVSTEFTIGEIEKIVDGYKSFGTGKYKPEDLKRFETVLKNKDQIIEKIKAKL